MKNTRIISMISDVPVCINCLRSYFNCSRHNSIVKWYQAPVYILHSRMLYFVSMFLSSDHRLTWTNLRAWYRWNNIQQTAVLLSQVQVARWFNKQLNKVTARFGQKGLITNTVRLWLFSFSAYVAQGTSNVPGYMCILLPPPNYGGRFFLFVSNITWKRMNGCHDISSDTNQIHSRLRLSWI